MKIHSVFLEHVYRGRVLTEGVGIPPMDIRRLCLKANCQDLIRGMRDSDLSDLGDALSVYADINTLVRAVHLTAGDKERVRTRIQEVIDRKKPPKDPLALRTAALLAQASQVVPEEEPPAAEAVPYHKLGQYNTSHVTTHAHLVDQTPEQMDAAKRRQEALSLRDKVQAVQADREVPLALVKAEGMRKGVRWDTLIAADHAQARAGMDPSGGQDHAYHYYWKNGKVYRYQGRGKEES